MSVGVRRWWLPLPGEARSPVDWGSRWVSSGWPAGDTTRWRMRWQVSAREREATLGALAAGGREEEASVRERCRAVLRSLRPLPHETVAIVAHW